MSDAIKKSPVRRDAAENLDKLTRAVLELLRTPDSSGMRVFPHNQAILGVANEKFNLGLATVNSVGRGTWQQLQRRFRISLDPVNSKAKEVAKYFGIWRIRLAPTIDTIADEAARLHVRIVPPNATSFYSCGTTLADTARLAAASNIYQQEFTACSAVVLATSAAKALPPSAITAEFQRNGSQVKTLAYLLPAEVQHITERRRLRRAVEAAVFHHAESADFLWLGIGTLDQPGGFSDHCGPATVACLKEKKAIGEVGFMPFSETGLVYDDLGLGSDCEAQASNWRKLPNEIESFFNSTFVLKFSQLPTRREDHEGEGSRLREVPERPGEDQGRRLQVVVVAGGETKYEAIWHGLHFLKRNRTAKGLGGIDYFVTDPDTLNALHARMTKSARVSSRTIAFPLDTLERLEQTCIEHGRDVDEFVECAVRDFIQRGGTWYPRRAVSGRVPKG